MTLLAKVARHLSKETEVLATDALGAVLAEASAAEVIVRRLAALAPGLPAPLRFVTQSVGEDLTRPDVVGLHGETEVVHLEGKFWAALTPAQPNGYLARLASQPRSDGFSGLLVFVCPIGRVAELHRTATALAGAASLSSQHQTWLTAETAGGQVIVTTDWQSVLELLEQVDDRSVQEDVRQLRGLVDQVSDNSFQPWTAAELGERHLPRQLMQLADVGKEARDTAIAVGLATMEQASRPAGGWFSYWYPFWLSGTWAAISVDIRSWSKFGVGPLWLQFARQSAAIIHREFGDVAQDGYYGPALPLLVSAGMTRAELVDDVVQQLRTIAGRLTRATAS